MVTETQYVVPVLLETDETAAKIQNYLFRIVPTDRSGNLEHCGFCRVEDKWLGEFCAFQALDRRVAELAFEILSSDKDLKVLPVREVQYQG